MKVKQCIKSIVLLTIIVPFLMCSQNDDLGNLDQIRPDGPYKLFNVLDDYPALHDCFSHIDPNTFNDHLVDVIYDDPETSIEFFRLFHTLILKENGDRGALLYALDDIRGILEGIINQDLYDDEQDGDYANQFYGFMDKFTENDTHLIKDTFSILNKAVEYITDTYDEAIIDSVSDDLIFFLKDTEGNQTVKSFLGNFNKGMGKLLVRANKYDSNTCQVGNGVDGVDKALSSLQSIAFQENSSGRKKVFDLFRELGDLTAVKVDDKGFGEILKELGINVATYFDSNNTDPNYQNSNPYVNASFKNSIKEIYPGLIGLFLRSDREGSIIRDDGEAKYPLQILGEELNRLDFNISEMDLERSLYDMIRYDGHGKDRLNSSSGANGFTWLEHFLFNLMNSNYVGYLTRMDDDGEPHSNYDRGHGQATGGIVTVNDCLFSLETGYYLLNLGKLSINSYTLALIKGLNRVNISLGTMLHSVKVMAIIFI